MIEQAELLSLKGKAAIVTGGVKGIGQGIAYRLAEAGEEESKVEGKPAPWKQLLHPFVLKNPKGGYTMLYNSHSEVYTATSTDGLTWEKLGATGLYGADVDGYFQADGTIRIYYGDFSEATGGLVYMGVLKVQ